MSESNPSTLIVLASLDGAKYLAQQLESLVNQTDSAWRLLIGDDGSTDRSLDIIESFRQQDDRIGVLDRHPAFTASALGNFANLLSMAFKQGADYIFCCDQDDVWEPNRIELVLARLKDLEGEDKTPSLVHHDLIVVDEYLEPKADSFIDMMLLHPTGESNPQRLVSRNEVTGCAMACNRALLEIALPISEDAVMHDWWLALCAGYFGRLAFMPERLVKYRQHGDNTIGAKSFWYGFNPFTNWVAGWRRGDEEFIGTVKQARAFNRIAKISGACPRAG